MKTIWSILLFGAVSCNVLAQSYPSKLVENELLTSFEKISYYKSRSVYDAKNEDSLVQANTFFKKKLFDILLKYPATITQPFTLLTNEHLNIAGSDDKVFRIYSWDTMLGGTRHLFKNILQYNLGNQSSTYMSEIDDEAEPTYYYTQIYTLKTPAKTYYLAVYNGIFSSKDCGTGIKVYSIDNGKLNFDNKIIKTAGGMKTRLYYDYNFMSVADWKNRPTILFNQRLQTIKFPLVEADGNVTHQYITYKFNGQYFEKMD